MEPEKQRRTALARAGYKPAFYETPHFAYGVAGIVIPVTFAVDLMTPLGVAAGIPYIFATWGTLGLGRRRASWIVAGVAVALIWLAVLVLMDGGPIPRDALLNRFLSSVAVLGTAWIVTVHQRTRLELVTALGGRTESLSRLASGVAHDFNNLLTTVSWEISTVLDEVPLDPERREGLRRAEQICVEASDFVLLLHQYSASYEGTPRQVDIAALIADLQSPLRAIVEPVGRLEIALPERGSIEIHIDPTWIRQILVNLVSNAVAASTGHGVEIRVELARLSPHPAYLASCDLVPDEELAARSSFARIRVIDDGRGIPPEVRPKIFDPLFTTRKDGKGLGLASVHGLVRQLGGGIRVESTPGSGTCFEILLPLASDRGGD